jgi:hypothetical protein
MRKLATTALLFLACASSTQAADWFELKDFGPVTQRVAVTVENPADVDNPAALVHIPMVNLRKLAPDAKAGQICVVDPETKPAKREAADKNFVPSQVSQRTLIFTLPLKAGEKKTVYVYTAPAPLNMPGFAIGTQYDSRHAYRSFENRYAAFRMETGPGANTTGMVIDAFGKTKAGHGVRLQEIYSVDYHKLHPWGVDILKVGSGPGLGGVYVIAGDQMGRPEQYTTFVSQVYTGPVETKLRVTAPVKIGDRQVTVVRHLTLVADDRAILDEVTLQGDNLDGLQIGIGVRDLPNCTWVEQPEKGYAFQTGDANQQNYKAVGLGVTFDPKSFAKITDLPDKANGGHVYVLNPTKSADNALVSRHRLYDIWDMDGQLPAGPVETAEQLRAPFESWLAGGAKVDRSPVKVTLGDKAESK